MSASEHVTTGVDQIEDKDVLEQEIAHAREELVHTVDAIVDRVDPQRVAHRTQEQVRRTTTRAAEEAQDRVGQAVDLVVGWARREPLQAQAAAAGAAAALAWLVWESVRPTSQRQRSRRR